MDGGHREASVGREARLTRGTPNEDFDGFESRMRTEVREHLLPDMPSYRLARYEGDRGVLEMD